MSRIYRRFESGYYEACMQKGATKLIYFAANYVPDLMNNLIYVVTFVVLTQLFQIYMGDFYLIAVLWALIEPL